MRAIWIEKLIKICISESSNCCVGAEVFEDGEEVVCDCAWKVYFGNVYAVP